MWPTLSEGQASPRQELVHNIDPVTWTAAVRYQQWKLLVNESFGFDGWYPPPGLEEDAQHPHNVSSTHPTLKNAVVTCGPPPFEPAKCGIGDGPCLFNIEEDPCEYYNLALIETNTLDFMLGMLEAHKTTMVPIRNKPYDENADPKYHEGVWTAWCDEKPNENCGE